MKIVNSTGVLDERFGTDVAIKMLCEAGFEGIDYSMCSGFDKPVYSDSWRAELREDMKIAASFGASFSQTHGPIPSYQLDDKAARERFMDAARRSVEATAELGAEYLVFHPMRVARGSHEDQLEINLNEYMPLVEMANGCGVTVAFENMCNYKLNEFGEPVKHVCKSAEEHAKYIDAFGHGVVACLDTGHATLSAEEPCEFARMLGKRLRCLHVHDNMGVKDDHSIPYNMSIKFEPLINALRDIDYCGDLTLECNYFLRPSVPNELCAPALRYMAAVADYMRNKITAK